VIPSLLRKPDELASMMSTVESIAGNGYPGQLLIVLTIDGTTDAPDLYKKLQQWATTRSWLHRYSLRVTGTPSRRSKPMAIDHAMEYVKGLVASGEIDSFPPVYISTDADADLGTGAIEAIVLRLQKRNPWTGWPARIVAGALHVRGNAFWQGWRKYFSIAGQLNLQVAREYYVGNVWRHNIRWLPITGVPGAFHCAWSEIFLAIPSFMGYMQTLHLRHWLRWWFGIAPPRFSESTAAPIPDLMAGDTDDTVTAYASILARFENGRFTLDPPRTPLHAIYYLVRSIFWDRAIHYEPRAKVFTSSPTTIKALFRQRKRWNCSRIELTGRYWPALCYHWQLGLPVLVVKALLANSVVLGALAYFWLPIVLPGTRYWTGFLIGYTAAVVASTITTTLTLVMNGELYNWRMLLAVPFVPFYIFGINWMPAFVGSTADVLLFGNITGFSPETTLKRGGSVRIALAFRVRRALLLAVRSVVVGDVPLGWFWLGWRETTWTPSGYEGWTTGERPRSIVPPLSQWFSSRRGSTTDSRTDVA